MTHEPPPPIKSTSWRELLSWLCEKVQVQGWHLVVGTAVGALLLWLAFRDVAFEEVAFALGALDWAFITLALVVSIASTMVRAARWRLLYYPDQGQLGLTHLTGLLFISQMLNVLIPARVGELTRIVLMRNAGSSRTLGTIAVEKLLDLLTLLAFLLILPFTLTLPDWFRESSQGFMLLALGLFGLTLILFFIKDRLLTWVSALLRFLPERWGGRLQGILRQALASLDVFRNPWLGLRLSGWSFLVWGSGVLLNDLLFRAFGFDLPVSAALFLLLVLQVGVAVPSVPGKLGVFQYLTILALVPFGLGRGVALSYSLVLYLIVFGPHFLFGVPFGLRELVLIRRRHALQSEG